MRVAVHLTLRFGSHAEASRVDRATRVDNAGFLRSCVVDRAIEADSAADSPMSLLHSLEDYLACVSVSERVSRR